MQAEGGNTIGVGWPRQYAVLVAKLKECVIRMPEIPTGAPLPLDVLPLLVVVRASCEQLMSVLDELCHHAITIAGFQDSCAGEGSDADVDSAGCLRDGALGRRHCVHIALPEAMPAHASYCLAVAQLLLAATTAVELTDAMQAWIDGLHSPVHEWLLGFQPSGRRVDDVSQEEQAAAQAPRPVVGMPVHRLMPSRHTTSGWMPVRYDFLRNALVCDHGAPPMLLSAYVMAGTLVFAGAGSSDGEEGYLSLEGGDASLVQADRATEFVVCEGSLRATGPAGVAWLNADQARIISISGPLAGRLQVTVVAVGYGHCALYAALLSEGELPQPPLTLLDALASRCGSGSGH